MWRVLRAFFATALIVLLSVLVGTIGFRFLVEKPTWSESFHNACLLLGEHSLEEQPTKAPGRIFVGLYIMYVRLVFFTVVTILVLPILHRTFHKLHFDTTDAGDDAG